MSLMNTELANILACPRCDKSPLEQQDDALHCSACKVDFPNNGLGNSTLQDSLTAFTPIVNGSTAFPV